MSLNVPVNNPTKKIVVDFNIDEVKQKMPYLCKNSEYYKSINCDNAIINEFKINFKTPLSGLVDVGMTATINLSSISENKTQIDIEVCDNFDAIDDTYELKSAQMLIDEVSKGFGFVLTKSIDELNLIGVSQESGGNNVLKVVGWALAIFFILSVFCSIV